MNFTYDGEKSEDYGVFIGTTGGVDIPLISNKEVLYDTTPNRKTYFYGVKRELLSYNITIYPIKGHWETGQVERVLSWLDQEEFRPFTRSTRPNRVLYLMLTDSVNLTGASQNNASLDLPFTNISPFIYSPVYHERVEVSGSCDLELLNEGDLETHPVIKITPKKSGVVALHNISDPDTGSMVLDGLAVGEQVVIDCLNRNITSSESKDIHKLFNHTYTSLKRGKNKLKITGNCDCEIFYHYVYKV